jgi:HEAT repeat protein
MKCFSVFLLLTFSLFFSAPGFSQKAKKKGPTIEDVQKFEKWLELYSNGQKPILIKGRVNRRELNAFRVRAEKIASGNDLTAAKRLFSVLTLELNPELNKYQRLAAQEGMVRDIARSYILKIQDPSVDGWLLTLLAKRKKGKSAVRQRIAIIDMLGIRANKKIGKLFFKRLGHLSVPDRIQALLVLPRLGNKEMVGPVLRLLKQREPNLKIAAIQALTGLLAPYSDETVPANLVKDSFGQKMIPFVVGELQKIFLRNPAWQVRAAVTDGLVRLKSSKSIPALIQALNAEYKRGKDRSERLLHQIHDGLEQLTGINMAEGRPKFWEDFWAKEGPTFQYGVKAKGKAKPKSQFQPNNEYVKYFNLNLRSKRNLFIVDFSGSMAERVRLKTRYARGAKKPKYEIVKKELEKVIRALPADSVANVIFFGSKVSIWRANPKGRPRPIPMTESNKADLLQYIWETTPGGATNLFGALKEGLTMADRGLFDKYYKTAFDSIYLLSDGAPSFGEIIDTGRILEEVRKINQLRRVKIHTIVFGDEGNNLTFMRRLAKENGGTFLHVQ